MFQRSGALLRPAQDCSVIYGGSLALSRVDVLSPDRFRQSTISHLVPARGSSISGVHTLNCAQGFEIVDVFATPSLKPANFEIGNAAVPSPKT